MKKKLTLTVLFILILTAITSTGVYAGFLSIPGYLNDKGGWEHPFSGKYATDWIISIRQMEEKGQGLGFSETIDTTTGMFEKESNHLDVHLAKNTEYGAALLLGTSDYGKQGAGGDRYIHNGSLFPTTNTEAQASTTGNVSGIYQMHSNYEWVAGGGDDAFNDVLPDLAKRYINRYTLDESSARVGDATVETKNWQAQGFTWLTYANYGFQRASFYPFPSPVESSGAARGVIICEERSII